MFFRQKIESYINDFNAELKEHTEDFADSILRKDISDRSCALFNPEIHNDIRRKYANVELV
jgi:hypothetical protein